MNFGQTIRSIRKDKKLSLKDVAKTGGISHPYISQIETGKRSIPKPNMIKKLAIGLDVPYNQLMDIAGYNERDKESGINSLAQRELYLKLLSVLDVISYNNEFYNLVSNIIRNLELKYDNVFEENEHLTPEWLKEKVLSMDYKQEWLDDLINDLINETSKIPYADWLDRLPDEKENSNDFIESVEKHEEMFGSQFREGLQSLEQLKKVNDEQVKLLNDDIGFILRNQRSLANYNGIKLSEDERERLAEYIEFLLRDHKD